MKQSRLVSLLLAAAALAVAVPVTPEAAQSVAGCFAERLYGPNTAGAAWFYEDLAAGPGAYQCERVLADGSSLTVLVGAKTEMPPVLAYWRDRPLDVLSAEECRSVAARALGQTDVSRLRAVYYTPVDMWFEYGAGGKTVMVSATSRRQYDPEQVRRAAPLSYRGAQALANDLAWQAYKKGEPPLPQDDSVWIENVADWDWHYGCAPTAAANVLTYWDANGYPLLEDSVMFLYDQIEGDWDFVSNANLQLAIAMNTDTFTGGTWSDDMAPGIEAVCNSPAWDNNYAFNSYLVWNNLSLLVSEVNNGRPGVLLLSDHPTYGNHAVTYVGWGPPNSNYVCIHDEWPTPENVVIYYYYGSPWVGTIPIQPGGGTVADMAVTSIERPAVQESEQPLAPAAWIRNMGNSSAPYWAFFIITGGATTYRDSITSNLGSGQSAYVQWRTWTPIAGSYVAKCSVYQVADAVPSNNTKTRNVTVVAGPPPPSNWRELRSVPMTPTGLPVKDGGSLAYMAADGKVYAVNGNGTLDFHCFDPATGYWTDLNRPPVGPAGKGIKRGGRLLADGSRYVYLIKGNSTLEFYRYDIFSGAWSSLTEVPAGSEGKGVKGGGDMVLVPGQGTNYIYFLKGNKTEFYRYSTAGNSWETRATAPAGAKGKWPKGSFLAYDGGSTIYAHKAATHEFYPYNVNTNAWGSVLAGMPQYSMSGKSKRSKDGAAAVWYNGSLYALKGGGTNEFWRFSPAGGWYEMDSAPYYGSTQAKKGFKAGGDLTADQNTFFAIKGNKTTEFWTYTIAGGDGGQARKEAATDDGRLTIAPNPVMSGFATVRYHRGQTRDALFPMTLHVYDASGRAVLAHPLIGASATLDLRGLSAGVYLVRVTAGGVVASQRLVVER